MNEVIARTRTYEREQVLGDAVHSAAFAWKLLEEIAASVRPGQRESEIKAFAADCFARHGVERIWHQPYIRFGAHTLLTYRDKAKEDRVLAEEDIAFIDIGIVRAGIEGDAGKTLVFGENKTYQCLQQASEAIFNEARAFWRKTNPTGVALYAYILNLAEKMQVRFNLDPAGHLIGAFPHRGWKQGLNHYPEHVLPGTWILEIQICDLAGEYGAFYEDLLY